MMYLIVSAALLVIASPFSGMALGLWLLVACQLTLLIGQIMRRQVTGVGAFVFLSFLFFGIRPLYMFYETDYRLFTHLFILRVDLADITSAMWWASAALWCFCLGAALLPKMSASYLRRRRALNNDFPARRSVSRGMVGFLLALQCGTLPVMWVLANSGRSLYGSAFGAYLYDAPMMLQSVNVFALVVLVEVLLRNKSIGSILLLALSAVLFLSFTWLMRDVTNFRSFYLTGVMVGGIAVLQRLKPRVGYAWLILPIILLQPAFRHLGEQRTLKNEELLSADLMSEVVPSENLVQSYWSFYRYDGDMNIFDTFVAAKKTEPLFRPYAWSWLYVPVHFVPRALWKGKPKQGITMDMSFTRGAPYSPGIAGFFLRDGGLLWMLVSMGLLGCLVSFIDCWVLTLPRSYLQCCLIGIVVVNGMYLSRFFLWQYVYQVIYAAVPCIFLAWYVKRGSRSSRRKRVKTSSRSPGPRFPAKAMPTAKSM
jgi:hypothetical protein